MPCALLVSDPRPTYVASERIHELVPDDGWYPPSIFFQGMKFAFLGAPTLPLE